MLAFSHTAHSQRVSFSWRFNCPITIWRCTTRYERDFTRGAWDLRGLLEDVKDKWAKFWTFLTQQTEMGNVCTGTNGSPQNLSLYFIKSSVLAPESIWALKTHLKCLKITELETKYKIKWQLFLRKYIDKHFWSKTFQRKKCVLGNEWYNSGYTAISNDKYTLCGYFLVSGSCSELMWWTRSMVSHVWSEENLLTSFTKVTLGCIGCKYGLEKWC